MTREIQNEIQCCECGKYTRSENALPAGSVCSHCGSKLTVEMVSPSRMVDQHRYTAGIKWDKRGNGIIDASKLGLPVGCWPFAMHINGELFKMHSAVHVPEAVVYKSAANTLAILND